MMACDNCGVDVDREPTTLCDECSGVTSEAIELQKLRLAVVEAAKAWALPGAPRWERLATAVAALEKFEAEVKP